MTKQRKPHPPYAPPTRLARRWRVTKQLRARHARAAWAQSLPAMPLSALMRYCLAEDERASCGHTRDPRFGHEIFRRALVERDEDAWEALYDLYRPLAERRVRQHHAFAEGGESSDSLVAAAFIRFWRAVSSDRFERFPTLSSLLHYLQLCADAATLDSLRSRWEHTLLYEAAPLERHAGGESPEQQLIERIDQQELWEVIDSELADEAERMVMVGLFVWGFEPQELYARHRQLFAEIGDVYAIKWRVLTRLSRKPELRQLLGR